MKPLITWNDFEKIDMRAGTIVSAELNTKARKPAYVFHIDFGEELGIRKSSAQITEQYQPEDLVGLQVMAVVNFPPKQIGAMVSECLICGCYTKNGVVLISPTKRIENGSVLG